MLKHGLKFSLFVGLLMTSGYGVSVSANEAVETLPYEAQVPALRQIIISETNGSRRRDLVPLPMKTEHNGPFGSFHYTPDKGTKDVFINKKTSCAFQNLLSEWREKQCPSYKKEDGTIVEYEERGCRVAFGDISHRDYKYWNGHRSHTNGYCIDLRPMRKGGFENAPLFYGSSNYDAAKTADFLELAKKYGATNMLFNDPNIRSRPRSANYVSQIAYSPGHNNHMHICIRPENIPNDPPEIGKCPTVAEALK
jgi:hypothetical protein